MQPPGVWAASLDLLRQAHPLVTMIKDLQLACTHDTYRY